MEKALDRLGNIATLYSLPEVYYQLRVTLDNPDYSITDVAAVIGSDPGMTARLLKLANSAFYGFASKIYSVSHAIGMIGIQQLQDLVLATSVTKTFAGISSNLMNMDSFWQKSIRCGVVARLLASRCGVFDSERLFVTGLLCEIGHLVMYQQLPELSQQSILRSREEGVALYEVEREIFGFDYAQAGGELTRLWRLPGILQSPIRYQLEPTVSSDYPLAASIAHVARKLATPAENGVDEKSHDLQVSDEVWTILELTPDECVRSCEDAELQVAEISELIFPAAGNT